MQLTLATFLERRGFQHNPFETPRAERERELLPRWFRPSVLFDRIVGDPARPETCLLFAPTGHGKTSHRIEVARRVQERVESPALAIELTEFDVLLRDEGFGISLETYLEQIHRLFLEALVAQLGASPERLGRLQRDQASYLTFCALLHLHAPHLLHLHARVLLPGFLQLPQIEEHALLLRQQQRGARQRLATLVALARTVDFIGIYVLVDGVDELSLTRNDPALMARMLAALLDAPGVLELPGLAFKFFLPIELRAVLIAERIGRLDIFRSVALSWSDAELRDMLATRLRMCSQLSSTSQGSTRCFSDLCAAPFDVDGLLAQAADGSPRRLLSLCGAIVELHLRRCADPDEPIAVDTIHAALAAAEPAPRAHALGAPDAPAPPRPVPPPASPRAAASPLWVDARGDIWLGAQRSAQRLPHYLRLILDCLWANRERAVTYDELIQLLYGANLKQRADPHESLRKLVINLREKLEPGQKNSYTYIEQVPGVGYVLRNTADERP